MNTSPFALPGVLASMQGLWRWFTATSVHGQLTGLDVNPKPSETKVTSVTNMSCLGTASRCTTSTRQAPRPVRVIRILEASQAPAQAGRMVMSGRMADVCAELDRLAAREAALH